MCISRLSPTNKGYLKINFTHTSSFFSLLFDVLPSKIANIGGKFSEKRSWGVRMVTTTRIFQMGPFKKGVTWGGWGLNGWVGAWGVNVTCGKGVCSISDFTSTKKFIKRNGFPYKYLY